MGLRGGQLAATGAAEQAIAARIDARFVETWFAASAGTVIGFPPSPRSLWPAEVASSPLGSILSWPARV
jgi:hypothetical protein